MKKAQATQLTYHNYATRLPHIYGNTLPIFASTHRAFRSAGFHSSSRDRIPTINQTLIWGTDPNWMAKRGYAGAGSTKREKHKQKNRDQKKAAYVKNLERGLKKSELRKREREDKISKQVLVPEKEFNQRNPPKPQIKNRLTHDGRDYQMLRAQTAKMARKALEDLQHSKDPIQPLVLFKIVKGLEKEGKNCSALNLVPRVKGGASLSHYAPLILQLVEMKAPDSALHLYDTMKQEAISPNEKVFRALVSTCVEHDKKDRLLELLQEVVAFNSSRPAHPEGVKEEDTKAEGDDGNTKHHSTYAVDMPGLFYLLISSSGKLGKLDVMAEFFGKARQYGVSPDLDCHDTVIRHLLKGNKIESSFAVLDHMRTHGPTPTTKTFSMFVDWYSQKGEMDKAEDLMKKMKEVGAVPNVVTLTSIVFGHAKQGDLPKALLWVEKMKTDYDVQPNIVTYNALLTAHDKQGDSDSVFELFTNMIRSLNIQPNRATFKILLELCLRLGQRERGMHYIGLMESLGFEEESHRELVKKIEALSDNHNYSKHQF